MLLGVKSDHEDLVARTTSGQDLSAVSLLVHVAFFGGSAVPQYFLKVTNEGTAPVRLDAVWFDTTPQVVVDNPHRPLPAVLHPGELFETWQAAHGVPAVPSPGHVARARLSDGTVVRSRPNTAVLPAGIVGGGGRPLTDLVGPVAAVNHDGGRLLDKERDVFISHASEDKDAVVRPLAHALRAKGLRVWYDEFELRIGDSLRRKIDEGIAHSRFGVVVLSPSFLTKGWTTYELDGLITRGNAAGGGQVVLPVLHGLTIGDLLRHSPSLADRVARDTAVTPVDVIADEIFEVVSRATVPRDRSPHVSDRSE
ncbi:hypothetical protein BBK82_06745 [Lentzea guizhouensis]|uniref:TIR domain-containing protein n=1 Tax=Lentzea guizhouensis TaxID=1586287 RepID=A0A1B2HDM5_9PSEU|nr:toll/interleukin-1 receptor domain-containing protein [Lentzea guizhouensis]ANZ35827.1 hypothetical protein BBK82_06745 [Lentzea guizhouensis]